MTPKRTIVTPVPHDPLAPQDPSVSGAQENEIEGQTHDIPLAS